MKKNQVKRAFTKGVILPVLITILLCIVLVCAIKDKEFLKALLPNLFATVLGIPIALPFGLWKNSLIVAQTEKVKRKEEAARLYQSLAALQEALYFNILQFGIMLEEYKNGKAFFAFTVDYSTWDVVKNDLIKYLDNPHLSRRIAYYFYSIEELRKIESIYLDNTIDFIPALRFRLREPLSRDLPTRIAQLCRETQSLIKDIDLEQANILSKYCLLKSPE